MLVCLEEKPAQSFIDPNVSFPCDRPCEKNNPGLIVLFLEQDSS